MSLFLTPHFKLSEFTNSSTAKAQEIDNTPTLEIVERLQLLCINVLEPLRNAFDRPICIGSGFRCAKLNKAVGGVSNSQHMTGEAADIHVPDVATGREWFEWIRKNCIFDQLICERENKNSTRFWIHVSFKSSGNRRQVINDLVKNK